MGKNFYRVVGRGFVPSGGKLLSLGSALVDGVLAITECAADTRCGDNFAAACLSFIRQLSDTVPAGI